MKKHILHIIILLLAFSCEEQTDWDLQSAEDNLIYIEAIITNENKIHEVVLSRSVTELNVKSEAVSGATIVLEGPLASISLIEDPPNSGKYRTPVAIQPIVFRNYNIQISYQGHIYTAASFMEPGREFIPTTVQYNPPRKMYRIRNVAQSYHPAYPAMFELLLDWSEVEGYEQSDPEDCKARLFYYTLSSIDVTQLFAPDIEMLWFPKGTQIIEKRYSLNDEHAEFVRQVLLETEWSGGLFSTASANVISNLSDGAAGFFGACGVTIDTLYVGED